MSDEKGRSYPLSGGLLGDLVEIESLFASYVQYLALEAVKHLGPQTAKRLFDKSLKDAVKQAGSKPIRGNRRLTAHDVKRNRELLELYDREAEKAPERTSGLPARVGANLYPGDRGRAASAAKQIRRLLKKRREWEEFWKQHPWGPWEEFGKQYHLWIG